MFGRPSFPDLAGAIAPAAAWSQDTSWQCLIQLGILGNGTRNIADFQVVTPKHCFLLFINLQREAEAKIEVISHYITLMFPPQEPRVGKAICVHIFFGVLAAPGQSFTNCKDCFRT